MISNEGYKNFRKLLEELTEDNFAVGDTFDLNIKEKHFIIKREK